MSAMLRSLRIRNLALVEELSWELPSGFTTITGETGAGKSIIIGALKFLLGERADRGVVRSGASSAGIEAVFALGDSGEIDALLEERGVDLCQDGELILKRSIAAEGSSRQFINGSPCTLGLLKELGAFLVDLHGFFFHEPRPDDPQKIIEYQRAAHADGQHPQRRKGPARHDPIIDLHGIERRGEGEQIDDHRGQCGHDKVLFPL